MWINVSNDLVLNECLATWYSCEKKTCAIIVRYWGVGRVLWLSRVAQLVAAWQRESGGRMRKWRGHGERMRKWRNIHSLYFFIISSLSIHFRHHKLSHFVAKCWIRHFCCECHKKLIYVLWDNNSGSNSLRTLWGPVNSRFSQKLMFMSHWGPIYFHF